MLLSKLDLSDKSINPLAKFSDFSKILNLVIPLLVGGAALLAVAMALIGGYTLLTAAGDAEKVKTAQKTFKGAVIGFVIVFTAFLLVKLIEIILGIDLPL